MKLKDSVSIEASQASYLDPMTTKLDELLQKMAILETRQHSPCLPPLTPVLDLLLRILTMKLDVPCFDEIDPSEWVFKIMQFFEYHSTLDHERLTIASFYMEGLALTWFQWMTSNGQISSWPGLFQALEAHFALS